MSSARAILWPVFLALAIIAFVVAVFGIGDENFLIQAHDTRVVLPDRMGFYGEAIRDGRLPLWNPHTFSGAPFLANPATAVFYPTSLLFVGLTPSSAVVFQLVLHLLFGAFGMYLLARRTYALSAGASLFAAMLYAMGGRVVGHGFAGHTSLLIALAYIPMLAFVVDRASAAFAEASGHRRGLGRFGPWPWIGGLLLGLQIFSGGLPTVWLGLLFLGLLRFGGVLGTSASNWRAWTREATVLALITILGLLVAAVQLVPGYEFAAMSDRPRSWQYASGGSFHPRMFRMMFDPRAVLRGKDFFWEFYGYIGLLPLLLALVGLSRLRRDPRILLLACIAFTAVLFMLGKHFLLFPLLWEYVPTFDIFRVPARAMLIVHLVIALLAAFGIDAVTGWLKTKKVLPFRAIGALLIALFLVTWLDIVGAARWYQRWLFTPVNVDLVWNFDAQSPTVIESRAAHAEVLSADRSWYRFWFDPVHLRRNYSFENGGHSVGGYDLMMLNRYSRFLHFMTFTPIDRRHTFPEPMIFDPPIAFPLKVLGVKYMDFKGKLAEQTAFPIRRAWFATRAARTNGEMGALEYMRDAGFRRFEEVVLEDGPASSAVPTAGNNGIGCAPEVTVEVADITPELMRIKLGPHPPGWLALSEIYYPGWRAEIDGTDAQIVRCDSILRCLPLPESATPQVIEMSFRPATLLWGGIVTIAALLIIATGLITNLRPHRAKTRG